jgi:hypothetical protein
MRLLIAPARPLGTSGTGLMQVMLNPVDPQPQVLAAVGAPKLLQSGREPTAALTQAKWRRSTAAIELVQALVPRGIVALALTALLLPKLPARLTVIPATSTRKFKGSVGGQLPARALGEARAVRSAAWAGHHATSRIKRAAIDGTNRALPLAPGALQLHV